MKKITGFTLIELVAVIVVLGIILAIAVPSIMGVISSSTKGAFESDAKLVLKAINYKELEDENFNKEDINESTIGNLLGLSNNNYESINIAVEDSVPIISIIGTNKWDGLIACGTFQNMEVVDDASNCEGDKTPPVLTLLGNENISMYIGETYIDAGATANDNLAGNITDKIEIEGAVNPNKAGIYTITYTVSDLFMNVTTKTRKVTVIDNAYPKITFNPTSNATYGKVRNITLSATDLGLLNLATLKYVWTTTSSEPSLASFVNAYGPGDVISSPSGVSGTYYLWATATDTSGNKTTMGTGAFNIDNAKPFITLIGSNQVSVNKGSSYTDLGATVTDNVDTSISAVITGSVNTNVVGSYNINFNATDSSGNAADTVTRIVNVVDVLAPVITIQGSNPVMLPIGSTYTDAGATALDDVDGVVSVTSTSNVNPNAIGSYIVTYTAKDAKGNTSTATRTINVIDTIAPTITFGANGSTTYARTRSTTVTVNDNVSVNVSSLKYQWTNSTAAPTEASFSSSFTNSGTINSPSSITGGYYLWILGKDTSGNIAITRSNIFNLDNTAPSVPTVNLNGYTSNTWTSSNIAFTLSSTDANAGIYQYQYSFDGVNWTASLGATGWTYTWDANDSIVFRSVDNAGNASSPTSTYVFKRDATTPTITASGSSYTVTSGVSNVIPGSYFTSSSGSLAPITSTVCVDTSNGNAAVSNTSTLAVGTHVIKCTAAKASGLSNYATTSIIIKAAYSCTTGTLTNDATLGYICLVSTQQYCYTECPDGHYYESCTTYTCNQYTTGPNCTSCGVAGDGHSCLSCTYCSNSTTITSMCPVGSCTPRQVCSNSCPSGYSSYNSSYCYAPASSS